MPRTFEVFKFRGDNEFDKMIKPIRTAFKSATNVSTLKRELDKLGANVNASALADYMEEAYITDDDVQRAELSAARGEVSIKAAVDRLNSIVIDTIRRKVLTGGKAAYEQFLDEAQAFLTGNQKKIYTKFSTDNKVQQYTRQDVRRHAGYLDMFRFTQ